MHRQDAENLIHHHYRLHAKVTSVVDTSPPYCMYRSPKSVHYRPFVPTRPRSVEPVKVNKAHARPYGREELSNFLSRALPETTASSHNAFARSSSAMSLLSNKRTPSVWDAVKPRILDSRNYQPPSRRPNSMNEDNNRTLVQAGQHGDSPFPRASVTSLPAAKPQAMLPKRVQSATSAAQGSYYRTFKESILSDIMLRGVYSDKIIIDTIDRTSASYRNLDPRLKEQAVREVMNSLGVAPASIGDTATRTNIGKIEAKRRIATAKPFREASEPSRALQDIPSQATPSSSESATSSVTSKASNASSSGRRSSNGSEASTSVASSDGSTTIRSSSTEETEGHRSGSLYGTSSEDFDMDAPPPRVLDSSTDLDEIARRLSTAAERENADDFADRESSLISLDDEDLENAAAHARGRRRSSGLEDIMEKARLMDDIS